MASRDLLLLHPVLREKCQRFLDACVAAGHPALITCTGRSFAEQEALYAQGRNPLSVVNGLRNEVGLYPLSAEENRRKVTWTLRSQHILQPNGFCSAFDFALLKDKKAHWDLKVSVDNDTVPDYIEASLIAKELGLDAGGFWKTPDFPHCQLLMETV